MSSQNDVFQPLSDSGKKVDEDTSKRSECRDQDKDDNVNNTNNVNTTSTIGVNTISENISNELSFDLNMPTLEDISTFNFLSDHEEADMINIDTTIQVSPVPTIRIYKDLPLDQVIGDLHSTTQTRNMLNNLEEHRGKIDKTLFIRRHKDDILLVQVYVDDIIFGSTKKEFYNAFEKMMHEKFQMISMGELTFFLGLQKSRNVSTPMETQKPLLKDKDGKEVDVYMYRSMIGSLMYLTSSRPDIMFTVCACARYQVNPKVSHLHDVKRIFRYLKGQLKFGLWYLKDPPFDLVAYTDSDYARASLDRKSITGDAEGVDCLPNVAIFEQLTLIRNTMASAIICFATNQKFNFSKYIFESMVKNLDNVNKFLMYPRVGKGFSRRETPLFLTMMVQAQEKIGEGLINPTNPHYTPTIIQPLTSQHKQVPRKTNRMDTELPQTSGPTTNVANKVVNEEMNDSLVRAVTTASSLEVEQDSGGGPRCQEAMRDTITQTRSENVSKFSNDSLITKVTQANEIDSLKQRVKKLKKKQRSRTHKLKRLYKVGLNARVESSNDDKDLGEDASKQGRISVIDADEGITLVSTHDDAEMFDVDQDLSVTTAATTPTISIDEVTLDQALAELKHKKSKAKAKGIVFHEPEDLLAKLLITNSRRIWNIRLRSCIELQAELQAKVDKEQRLSGVRAQQEEEEANIALIESWYDVQAKINADYQLAERLQAKEQQKLNDEEKTKLFIQLLEKRRKFFAAKRAEEKRNKPPTQAQQRKIICTYLKNMEGKKLTDLKNKSFDSI
nr:hypothetical protein [Tanacetum cinerariifolium]